MTKECLKTEPIIVPIDPNALNAITWFEGDSNNVRTWCSYLFNNPVDITKPEIQAIKSAIQDFLAQVQDDINTINKLLDKY